MKKYMWEVQRNMKKVSKVSQSVSLSQSVSQSGQVSQVRSVRSVRQLDESVRSASFKYRLWTKHRAK